MNEEKEGKELLLRAMKACSGREYCINEIKAMLERWGADSEDTIEKIIRRLVAESFIDENRYSRAFALDHFRYSHWGKVKISMGLRNKRIPEDAIAHGLEAIDEEEYITLLRKVIDDQRRKINAKNRFDLKGKLLRHAVGKGFESHLVYEVINSLFRD
jgi:regulatory protein